MSEHRYQGYAHPELYKMINSGPGVSVSIPVEAAWKTIADTLAQIDGDLHTALTKMGADWESDAADAAGAALSPLADWAGFAEQGATTMKDSARLQGEFIADARKKMPEVVPVTAEKPGFLDIVGGVATGPVGVLDVVNQQRDHERQEAAADNAAAQAVKVMEDYESDSRWNSSTLGEFPDPPQIVIDTPPPAQTGDGSHNVGYTSKSVQGPSGNTGTTTPSWTPPPAGPPVQHLPAWTPPGDTTHTSWTQPPSTPNPPPTHLPTNLPANEPPRAMPTPTPGPVFTRPSTGVPGGGKGGSGAVKGGAMGGKPFGPMSGSLGASGQGNMKPVGIAPGMGAGPDGMRGGAMGAGGAAGKGGAAGAGMGAGGAQGQRGEGEGDIEHKSADYLVETDDVFGDDRMVAPPVIGGLPE